jgi:dolichol-phosphate mannosyltransferase
MDADRSHDPNDVPRLVAALAEGADLAVGSRYRDGIRIINWPLGRLLLSSCSGVYVRTLCAIPMTDPTSGFKMVSRKALAALDMGLCTAQGYGFIVEFHFDAWRRGFRIEEVPIIFTERQRGASKMSKKIIVESALTVLKLAARRLFRF